MKYLLILSTFLALSCNSKEDSKNETNDKAPKKQDTPLEDTVPDKQNDEVVEAWTETLNFPSNDGLEITADLARISEDAPYILLCHQAGFSRGEYIETFKWFNQLGFNTLAIDQRSGQSANDINNETAKRAKDQGLPQAYLDAEQDITAAIAYISKLNDAPIYILGSSYSSSLVLKIAADTSFEHRSRLEGVLSYSPGEYLRGFELTPALTSIQCPVFVTSSKEEIEDTEAVCSKISGDLLTHFKPEKESIHGSRALWTSVEGYEESRAATAQFLAGR